ncbi:hypothetical protein Phum_PHUM576410 [Pediculus humanus corporis]|uniref:Uncharacterized protein n=1 Tax=Pediculus humanus subsp. corporis TaxID=121224 RepID=E0W1F3_PEDHC|nr:uncharacterized protein Phum_PHUM576410 [Pediculus humanus corporis]EEB19459.1 hypothetical protein Phum_PHUM576410 [Pediculus humanus corporis]
MRSLLAFLFVILTVLCLSDASPYNKYGRTCKDILCTVREECVMQRDECTGYTDKCGTYPTCKRKPGVGKTGCAAMKCPVGHFCSIRQENCDKPPCQIKPTCIAFRTPSPNRASNVPVYNRPFQTDNRYSYNSPFNRNSWSFDRISG